MKEPWLFCCTFPSEPPFAFPSFLNTADPSALRVRVEERGKTVRARPPAAQVPPSLTWTSKAAKPGALPAAPGAAKPRFPRAGLLSGPCNLPNRARTGPPRPARPQQPLDPRQRGWAWGPTATAPPTPALEERVRPTRYASLGPTCRGTAGLLDSGHGLEGGRQGGRSPSRGP